MLYWPLAATLPIEYQYSPGTSLLDTLTFEIAAGRELNGHPEEMIGATGSVNSPALQTVFTRLLNIDSPCSSMRCALCTSLSRMLSATVGSPI
jgi:hypothetical protein